MSNSQLELDALEFEVGAFRIINEGSGGIFYFENDEKGIIKKQIFLDGTYDTSLFKRELGVERYDNDMLLKHPVITLVLEKGGENRILAIANAAGDCEIIRNTYQDYGKTFYPNGNISYFKERYKVNENDLYDLIDHSIEELKSKNQSISR